MADEFDPSKLDRIVSKMAELQLSLAELVRESVKNDVLNKTEVREEQDTTLAAIKAVESTLQSTTTEGPLPSIQEPQAPPQTQEFRQPESFLSAPSIREVETEAPSMPGREQDPLNLFTSPAFSSTLPPQEPQSMPEIETAIPALVLNQAALPVPVFNQSPPEPEPFKPSSAGDIDLAAVEIPGPAPLELPGDKLDPPPDVKDVEPQEIPPFVMDSSPVVRLDQTTQQTHWEQDLFSDAVAALTDYRDESRQWRRNLISILEHMCQDLRMDNTILESILRHFELSRRSP